MWTAESGKMGTRGKNEEDEEEREKGAETGDETK